MLFRSIDEGQKRIAQLEKQLKSKQEELDISKSKVENLNGLIDVEEAKRDWMLKTKDSEIKQLQETYNTAKDKFIKVEEEIKKKANMESSLIKTETNIKELKNENQRLVLEKDEIKKYAETLLLKLKKQDNNSSFLVLLYKKSIDG